MKIKIDTEINKKINVIILASGNFTRMNSKRHKSLHKIANLELIEHIFLSLSDLLILESIARIILVCDKNFSFETSTFEAFRNINIEKVYQEEKLGTGHAVQIAQSYLDSKLTPAGVNGEVTLILYGDTPLTKSQTLLELIKMLSMEAKDNAINGPNRNHNNNHNNNDPNNNDNNNDNANDLSLLLFNIKNYEAPYGRIIFNDNNESISVESSMANVDIECNKRTSSIVECREYKDLTVAERKEFLIANAGIMAIKTRVLQACLPTIKAHEPIKTNRKEYYLTDLIKIVQEDYNKRIGFLIIEEEEAIGINTREDLTRAEYFYQERLRAKFLSNGVSLLDKNTVYFSYDTKIGQDVLIHPNVYMGPGVEIADNVEILSFSHLQNAKIDSGTTIGPFARIQGDKANSGLISNEKIKSPASAVSKIGKNCAIGNFVEIKNSEIKDNVKIKHLSYIGDSYIGQNSNIGGGTVTCNFDGTNKNKTFIGNNCFIGANNTIIAPLTISDRASTAGGSTITENIPEGALAIGRARQTNKENKE